MTAVYMSFHFVDAVMHISEWTEDSTTA